MESENKLKSAIIGLIAKENDMVLSTGENEYYMYDDEYSATIEYSLYKSGGYVEPDSIQYDGYSFKILSVFMIDNKDDSECELNPDADIQYAMLTNSEINDWSSDYDFLVENN